MSNLLKSRIFEISYKNKISHLSSNISSVDIIDEIFSIKKNEDIFILSNGHAGLALYVVLEKYYGINAEELYQKHGVHPHRDVENKIIFSSGSLGCGIAAASGFALANKNIDVYVLISDGEAYEGSIWETFNLKQKYKLDNLKVYCNLNGFSAIEKIDSNHLEKLLTTLDPHINIKRTSNGDLDFLEGIPGHYYVMQSEDYSKAVQKYA